MNVARVLSGVERVVFVIVSVKVNKPQLIKLN